MITKGLGGLVEFEFFIFRFFIYICIYYTFRFILEGFVEFVEVGFDG